MYKVLIVEDEMLVRLGLKNSIDWAKHDMIVTGDVSNGKAALDFYMENKPDIIITDIKMPVMNGMELITKIREKDDKTRIIILSCLEEFDTVRKAISLGVSDYILKLTMTEEEIDAILEKVRNEIREQIKLNEKDTLGSSDLDVVKDRLLKDFMFYRIYSSNEFTRRIKGLCLTISPENMIIVIMEIDHYENLKAHFEDDKGYLTNFALMNAINEVLKRYTKGEVFYDEGPRYILLINPDLSGSNDLLVKINDILGNIKNSLNIYFNASVSFGLSRRRSGFEFLKSMYLEAVEALGAKFFHGPGIFFGINDIDRKAILKDKYSSLYKLYDLLGVRDEGYKKEFYKKIQSMQESMPDKKEQVKDSFCQYLHWVTDSMHLSGDEIYGLLSAHDDYIKNAETLDEVIECIKEFIYAVRNSLKTKSIISNEISKAIGYMRQNYSQEISLQDVAEHVILSPSYFSSLFKKELKVNFIEYLNEIRIEKAKELLRDTCLKSYEIAEKVGFKESTYFSMLFKKATGLSPNKFRQIWQKTWKEDNEGEII